MLYMLRKCVLASRSPKQLLQNNAQSLLALCCSQMGLGKTIQTIAYLSTLQCADLCLL